MTDAPAYDVMCEAVRRAWEHDEIDAIAKTDPVLAIWLYAQQAANVEAEAMLVRVRLRAERELSRIDRQERRRQERERIRRDGEAALVWVTRKVGSPAP